MASFCPICYRESEGSGGVRVRKQKEEKFFRLFLKYLEGVEDSGLETQFKNQLCGGGIVSCEQCLPLMESFCELYHQLKTTELHINWKVETLKDVMRSAQSVPSRMNNLRNFMAAIKAPEKYHNLINSRRWLIKKCCQKLRNALPTLSIEKWRSDEGAVSTKLLQSKEEKSTGNTFSKSAVFNKNPLEPTSLQVSAHSQSDESNFCDNTCNPRNAAVDKTVLPIRSDPADDITDPGGTLIADAHQIETHEDDQLSTQDDGHGTSNLNDDDHSSGAFAPNPIPTSASDNLLKCRPLRIKIEPLDRTKMAGKCNVDNTCTSTRRDVSQIKLENPHELPTPTDLINSDTDLISEEPHTKKLPRLRSTHRCQHCSMRFSSDERLQLHIQQEHKSDQSGSRVLLASDSDNDQNQIEDNDAQMDIDSSCFSSSSSEEEKDDLESDYRHTRPKSISGTNNKSSKKHRQPRRNPKRGPQLRFKCLDCSVLVDGIRSFLLHRKTSKSCRHSYDPIASNKVEILTVSKDMETGATLDLDEADFVDVFALVDLPQEIYICETCDVAAYSSEDMEAHEKLHGTFKCNFCNVTKAYAPDLALHESQAHNVPKNKMRANRMRKHVYCYNCARCGFGCDSRNLYIRHHLSTHLSLTFNYPKCPICKTHSDSLTDHRLGDARKINFQISTHLKTHHDLSNLANVDDLKRCNAGNCRAYFLTAEQLTEHENLRHGLHDKGSTIQQYRLKCPDCNGLFLSTPELLTHRKTSDSCSGSYDPSKSVKVEVLTPPKEASEMVITPTDSSFVDVLAVVELPQEIYICDSCELAVYSSEDMEAHKKLHDCFKCHFCKVTKSYAPDLALHEVRAHRTPKNKGTPIGKHPSDHDHTKGDEPHENIVKHFPQRKRDSKVYYCARCDFGSIYRNDYIAHHLSNHLSLTFNDPKCAICKTNSELMTVHDKLRSTSNPYRRFRIGTHLKTHHDLRLVTNADDLKKCKAENCRAYFLTAEQLKQHQKLRHAPVAQTKAPELKVFKRSIIRSISWIQPYYRFKCPDCEGLFQSATEFLVHRKTSDSCSGSYDPLKSIKVDLLIRPDASPKYLDGDETAFSTVHAILDLPQAIFVCDIDNCGTVQYSSEDMEAHKKLHGTFPCCFCKSEHSTAPKLSMHELKHSKKEKSDKSYLYACPRCDFRCGTRTIYVRHHVSSHLSLTLNEPVCPICKTHGLELLALPSRHAKHFKNWHNLSGAKPGDIVQCTVASCDAYFLDLQQLSSHLWFRHNIGSGIPGRPPRHHHSSKCVKAGEKQGKQTGSLKCRDCDRTYPQLKYLRAHRAKHHRPTVQCPKCNKSISAVRPQFLATHMKTHEISHFCELCGKEFKLKTHLQIHYKSHSGPDSWEFMCSVCSKKCLTKRKLDEHMRVHTQDKPFVCEICGVKYAHRHNLRIHVNSKHGKEVEDKPRKFDKTNLTSKKGAKRKRASDVDSELDPDTDEPDSHSDSDAD